MGKSFRPFDNESDCIQLGDMTIENRVDRVTLAGSLDLTMDKLGLGQARQLHGIISAVLTRLEKEEEASGLIDEITVGRPVKVKNPFEEDCK